MRRGLIKDVTEVLDDGIDMVGGTFPPDDIEDEMDRRKQIKKEVLAVLREVNRDERRIWRPKTSARSDRGGRVPGDG